AMEGLGQVPPEAAVTGAIVSLYKEELEPKSSHVLWMVHRLFGQKLDLGELREVARCTPGLQIQVCPSMANRKKFGVFLTQPPSSFRGFPSLDNWASEGLIQEGLRHAARQALRRYDQAASCSK
ncbi:unnamed protein product, partial [Polarella glacialis]